MKPSPPDELPPPEQLPSKPAPIRFVVWLAMGKALGLPIEALWNPVTEGAIVCDERLSGLLKSFRRAA